MYQFDESILEVNRTKVIDMLVSKFESGDKQRLEKLQRYYEGNHDKTRNKRTAKGKPNNKVFNPFAALIVDTIQGYLTGQPIKYTSENQAALERILDVYYNNDEEELNSEIVKTMSVCGEAYEYVYINEDKEVEFVQLPVNETILVYNNDLKAKPLMCVRYYKTNNALNQEVHYAEVYTKDKIEYYKGNARANLELVEEYTHVFGQVPVIHYKNNAEMMGDFEKIISLIDDYDRILSTDSDEHEAFRNAYLVIKGFGQMTEEAMNKVRNTGAFVLPVTNQNTSAAEISFVTKDLNTDAIQAHLEMVLENIHRFSQVPNFSDQKIGTSESGEAMKQKVWGFEQLTGKKERRLEQGLFERLRLVFKALNVLESFEADINEFSLRFARNLPTNVKEDIESLEKLGVTASNLGEEALADVLSKITIIQDPNQAAKDIKAEPEEEEVKASIANVEEYDENIQNSLMIEK